LTFISLATDRLTSILRRNATAHNFDKFKRTIVIFDSNAKLLTQSLSASPNQYRLLHFDYCEHLISQGKVAALIRWGRYSLHQ